MKQTVIAALMLLTLAGCRSAKQKAEYEEKRKALVAENAAKAAAEKAAHDLLEGKLRKTCNSKTVKMPTTSAVVAACQDNISGRYQSVDFPGLFTRSGSDEVSLVPNNCAVSFTSWFEGKNAFGQKVRTNYTCTWNPRTESVTVRSSL